MKPILAVVCPPATTCILYTTPKARLYLQLPLLRRIPQADAIHTMPLVCRGPVSFSCKDMTQVSAAPRTPDLRAHHPQRRVRPPLDCARDAVVVRRPPAPAGELGGRAVERCAAAGTAIQARRRCIKEGLRARRARVRVRERRLRAALAEAAELNWLLLVVEQPPRAPRRRGRGTNVDQARSATALRCACRGNRPWRGCEREDGGSAGSWWLDGEQARAGAATSGDRAMRVDIKDDRGKIRRTL